MIKKIISKYYNEETVFLDDVLSSYPKITRKEVLTYFDLMKNSQLILKNDFGLGIIDKKKQVAFLIQKDIPNDLKLEFRDLKDAMNKDLVLVKKYRKFNKVELIIERSLEQIIATTKLRRNKLTIETKDRFDQVVVCPNLPELAENTVVLLNVARITSDFITTSFSEVIGHSSDKNIDYLILAYENHWETKFNEETKKEATQLQNEPFNKTGREDLTNLLTFTIDGSDTKDIDDALSITHISDDLYEVGIHIADVAHYVKTGSSLDVTAKNRANSLYFPNWVIPMLPEELSNDLCSLNPHEEKLAMSVLIKITSSGIVKSYKMYESVIKTSYQLTYDEVNNLIINNVELKNVNLSSLLIKLNEIGQSLNKERNRRGQINFETKELKFLFNKAGDPIDVLIRNQGPAEQLIESLMILTNELVAVKLINKNLPVILRTHERPDELKLQIALEQLNLLGVNTNYPKDDLVKKLQKITNSTSNNKLKYIIHSQLLRSMQRAKYSNDIEVGHFGLASSAYAHFTAPIRRYSDLYLHRLIKDLIFGKASDKKIQTYIDFIPGVASHVSTQERVAIQIERDSMSITSYYYLKDEIGTSYKAMITTVNPSIMFAELSNGIEVAIPVRDLNFPVVYDERLQAIKSRKKTYELGTEINVLLISVNELDKQLNFTIVESESNDKPNNKDNSKSKKNKTNNNKNNNYKKNNRNNNKSRKRK